MTAKKYLKFKDLGCKMFEKFISNDFSNYFTIAICLSDLFISKLKHRKWM